MKKLLWLSLALGAMVFGGCVTKASSCNASKGMKCGAGKCGAAMQKSPKSIKCGAGKCGNAMKKAPSTMKCGAGKCGSK
ncbi:MAG: hypothetical protein DSZ06_00570 [Sulfurospirillum sp.]|nr:MAG: hypothetical protein DSZ06_00570 [Sulfurospirillum sp.]